MKPEIAQQLQDIAARLTRKGLFGRPGDSLSMKVPQTSELLWITPSESQLQSSLLDDDDAPVSLHAAIYRSRADAGALLFGKTLWSEQLASMGLRPPTLFDESARHIGPIASPVPEGDNDGLLRALGSPTNVAIYGGQFVRIGMTADRVVFNSELLEKCAMAFVIARSSGHRIRVVPGWVRYIAGRRLRKDQIRAAQCYERGQIPQGLNAY